MHQISPLVSSSVKNSLMDNIQLPSTPALFFPQKRITTYMIKKWQPSYMDSNVAVHISWVPTTQLWSAQIIKIYNTSANHRKSQATKLDGWNSSKTSITAL